MKNMNGENCGYNFSSKILYFVSGFLFGSIFMSYYMEPVNILVDYNKRYKVSIYNSNNIELHKNYYIDYTNDIIYFEDDLKNTNIIIKWVNNTDEEQHIKKNFSGKKYKFITK